jgi:hypothetical protein
MRSFRFNPVFQQWVMVGAPDIEPETLTSAHLLDIGKNPHFVAAHYPRRLFTLEPPDSGVPRSPLQNDILMTEQPALGEYELLLYQGTADFWQFGTAEWMHWLSLLQHRLRQLARNPHLHHVAVWLPTAKLFSLRGYLRVGEVVATAHPLQYPRGNLDHELAEKLRREKLHTLYTGEEGWLYVPSAPLHPQEMWYLPYAAGSSIEEAKIGQRREVAYVLSRLLNILHGEWPEQSWVIQVHTEVVGGHHGSMWWVQIYADHLSQPGSVPLIPSPEGFAHVLHKILGHLDPPVGIE